MIDWYVCTKWVVEKDLFRGRNGRRLDMEINDDRRNGETHCRLLALVVSVAVAHPSAHRVEEGEHEEERPPRAHLRRRRRRRVRGHLEKKLAQPQDPLDLAPDPVSSLRVVLHLRFRFLHY